MQWPHQIPPKVNKDTDNRLKTLDAAPSWILKPYEGIDSLNFGSGFDCFTSETEMVVGTASVKGTEAIKVLAEKELGPQMPVESFTSTANPHRNT
jgi:hypothetical protein